MPNRTAHYEVFLSESSGYSWVDKPFMSVDVFRHYDESDKDAPDFATEHVTKVATFKFTWASDTGNMSVETVEFIQAQAHLTFDLDLAARTMRAIVDAFTDEMELYDAVFEDSSLEFTIEAA